MPQPDHVDPANADPPGLSVSGVHPSNIGTLTGTKTTHEKGHNAHIGPSVAHDPQQGIVSQTSHDFNVGAVPGFANKRALPANFEGCKRLKILPSQLSAEPNLPSTAAIDQEPIHMQQEGNAQHLGGPGIPLPANIYLQMERMGRSRVTFLAPFSDVHTDLPNARC